LLGECGFGIALWSLCGRFSLWPFWIVAVLGVRLTLLLRFVLDLLHNLFLRCCATVSKILTDTVRRAVRLL